MRIAITTRLYFPLTGGVPVIARLLGTTKATIDQVRTLRAALADLELA